METDSGKSAPPRTHYEVLGIDRNADDRAIRRAYLKASLKYHPDKNPEDVESAKLRFVEIGRAYDVLKDPSQRAAYDRELARGTWTQWGSGHGEEKTYDSYRDAFDAFVAGMSEEELSAAMGVAAVVGSVIGSVVGARLGKGAGRAVGTAGSLVGSIVGSMAGSNLVRSVHDQSVDRLTYEERCRVAVERGQPMPERPRDSWESLKQSIGKTVDMAAASMGPAGVGTRAGEGAGTESRRDASSANDAGKWMHKVGAAVNAACAFAEAARNSKGTKNTFRGK